jgi:putative phage-type endonuclease
MSTEEKVKVLLEKYGQNDQRTDSWHAKRGEMLTASEIYKALPDATPSQKHELIMGKLVPRIRSEGPGPRALVWGTRFEPIAKEIYQQQSTEKIKIVDTTCIPHPKVSFLGASPDGIILSEGSRHGTLVEFKCPISREFSEDTPISSTYYHQMQLQLECTDLDECEYIEFRFKTLSYSEWVDSKNFEYTGFYAVSDDELNVKYRELEDDRDPIKWREEVLGTFDDWNIVYWRFEKLLVKLVKRESGWLEKNLPSFTEVWNVIQEHRKNNTLPEHPREKTTLTFDFN